MLVVEDEPYMATAIRDGLRLKAIAADIAGDGDTALELLSINAYDIAVLDRDIPGPSGDEIAERIVASGSGMPILMLTAADRLDDKASGFELGADDYLDQAVRTAGARAASAGAGPQARAQSGRRCGRSPACGWIRSGARSTATAVTSRSPESSSRCSEVLVAAEGGCGQRRGSPGAGMGRERRSVHQRRAHHGLGPAQTPRRSPG